VLADFAYLLSVLLLFAGDASALFLADLQQQQQQFCSVLEASLRVHGCLLQQQQLALREQAPASLVCLAELLPSMAEQQQPTPMLLSLLLSFCKLARVYAPGDPRLALALSSSVTSVLSSCLDAVWATASNDGGSSSSSSSSSDNSGSQVLPVCAVLARGLHCLAYALEQAACGDNRVPTAAALQNSCAVAEALQREQVVATAVTALSGHLCRSAVPGIDAAGQNRLKQQGELVLAFGGMEAASQGGSAGPEQLQYLAQQLQQFAAAAAAAVPLAAACNNPCCVGLECVEERQLVKGRRCSRCKAGYCSDACQEAHWKGHRKACKLLAAAAGARAWA
jgi:hypothetical protein